MCSFPVIGRLVGVSMFSLSLGTCGSICVMILVASSDMPHGTVVPVAYALFSSSCWSSSCRYSSGTCTCRSYQSHDSARIADLTLVSAIACLKLFAHTSENPSTIVVSIAVISCRSAIDLVFSCYTIAAMPSRMLWSRSCGMPVLASAVGVFPASWFAI
jgi:hypothetical protein